MCGHRRHHHRAVAPFAVERQDVAGAVERQDVAGAVAPQHRASDADREEVVSLLRAAVGAGLLDPEELAERTGAALSAKTGGELGPPTADLPPGWIRAERRAHRRPERARAQLTHHVGTYAAVMALLVTIWLVVALAAGAWYFWPVWPALGWGIGLVSHARSLQGSGSRDDLSTVAAGR